MSTPKRYKLEAILVDAGVKVNGGREQQYYDEDELRALESTIIKDMEAGCSVEAVTIRPVEAEASQVSRLAEARGGFTADEVWTGLENLVRLLANYRSLLKETQAIISIVSPTSAQDWLETMRDAKRTFGLLLEAMTEPGMAANDERIKQALPSINLLEIEGRKEFTYPLPLAATHAERHLIFTEIQDKLWDLGWTLPASSVRVEPDHIQGMLVSRRD